VIRLFYELDKNNVAAIKEALMFTKKWLHDSIYYGGCNDDLMLTLEKINNAYAKVSGGEDVGEDSEQSDV